MKELREEVDGHGNYSVRLRKNENSETLIKRFLRKTKKERLIQEIMDRRHYKKPTTKRREAHFDRLRNLAKLREKEKELLEASN